MSDANTNNLNINDMGYYIPIKKETLSQKEWLLHKYKSSMKRYYLWNNQTNKKVLDINIIDKEDTLNFYRITYYDKSLEYMDPNMLITNLKATPIKDIQYKYNELVIIIKNVLFDVNNIEQIQNIGYQLLRHNLFSLYEQLCNKCPDVLPILMS